CAPQSLHQPRACAENPMPSERRTATLTRTSQRGPTETRFRVSQETWVTAYDCANRCKLQELRTTKLEGGARRGTGDVGGEGRPRHTRTAAIGGSVARVVLFGELGHVVAHVLDPLVGADQKDDQPEDRQVREVDRGADHREGDPDRAHERLRRRPREVDL